MAFTIRSVAVIVIILVAVILYKSRTEAFATRRDKANIIYEWFGSNSSPNYGDYRKNIGETSDIVEYEDILGLFQSDKLTVESIEKYI